MALRHKSLILAFAAVLALGFAADAYARAGSGSSAGSRGGRTFSAPPATQTAPRGAAPMERSLAQPGQNTFNSTAPSQRGGLFFGGFGSGLMGGLLGGLVGAGLFGLLTGHGLFGGLGGLSSIFGLLLQVGLLFLLFKLVMGFIRSRRPAVQGAAFASGQGQDEKGRFGGLVGPEGLGGTFSGGRSGNSHGADPRSTRLDVTPADFNTFEQRLAAVQAAYGSEDRDTIRSLTTPEMAGYFAEELATNARKGLRNEVSEVKFLQGDLSEAWREEAAEYATVAMRFSLIDKMADRVSGKIVSGDPAVPQEATELWTFTRRVGGAPGDWTLSAIQQA
jgi:predicted lipid-binding transport protein (Tim44 family)